MRVFVPFRIHIFMKYIFYVLSRVLAIFFINNGALIIRIMVSIFYQFSLTCTKNNIFVSIWYQENNDKRKRNSNFYFKHYNCYAKSMTDIRLIFEKSSVVYRFSNHFLLTKILLKIINLHVRYFKMGNSFRSDEKNKMIKRTLSNNHLTPSSNSSSNRTIVRHA
jgi:type IV secretory pathway VirB3-like protein